jgi:hypothetical protein
MANNIDVKDAAGITRTVKTSETGGVHTPLHAMPDMLEVGPISVSAASVLFTQDVSNYASVAVQVTSPGTTCTVVYEGSNDNVIWYQVAGYVTSNNGSASPVTNSTTATLLIFPCIARYLRARVSTYTSGTVTVIAEFRMDAIPQLGVFVANAAANAVPISFAGTVAPASSATGAMTKARVMAAASTNATSVKASAARLYEIHLCNISAAIKHVKFYNKASAPTVGTDVPVATYPIPANGGRIDFDSTNGISFATGLAYAITGAVADTDTTAVAANDVVGELLFA